MKLSNILTSGSKKGTISLAETINFQRDSSNKLSNRLGCGQKWRKRVQLKEVEEELIKALESPSKPRNRTNYALKKVKYPPSDNE